MKKQSLITSTTDQRSLYLALELSNSEWLLGFQTGLGDNVHQVKIAARATAELTHEIKKAQIKFGSPTRTVVCYEAGRDGHWIHRFLEQLGMICYEVDSASIEVNRRAKHAKTDAIDVVKLLRQLIRYDHGERSAMRVLQVPGVDQEDSRHLHRMYRDYKRLATQLSNRIHGLLCLVGIGSLELKKLVKMPDILDKMICPDGSQIQVGLKSRIRSSLRFWQEVVSEKNRILKEIRTKIKSFEPQAKVCENNSRLPVSSPVSSHACSVKPVTLYDQINSQVDVISRAEVTDRALCFAGEVKKKGEPVEIVRRLVGIYGIGVLSAWIMTYEVFWRKINNRQQAGALPGLTPVPYSSGASHRDQGISKAGNRELRVLLIELSWFWLRYQPDQKLSVWFANRCKSGKRSRRVLIVAVARKLMVLLWRYVEHGILPEDVIYVGWEQKLQRKKQAVVDDGEGEASSVNGSVASEKQFVNVWEAEKDRVKKLVQNLHENRNMKT